MFVRIGTKKHIDAALNMLAEFEPKVRRQEDEDGQETVTVWAPDGDIIFQALPKDGAGTYICRYHEEVFDRDSAVG